MRNKCVLKTTVFSVCILLFCVALTSPVNSSQEKHDETNQVLSSGSSKACSITVSYTFTEPTIQIIQLSDTVYSRIELASAPSYGKPGEPSLPVFEAKILIPYGKKVDSVEVTPGSKSILYLNERIEPVGVPVPLSQVDHTIVPKPDERIYSSAAEFPGTLCSEFCCFSFRGFLICGVPLYPVQYRPLDNIVEWYSDVTVCLHLIDDLSMNTMCRGLSDDFTEISYMVDNPLVSETYRQVIPNIYAEKNYDLLIITRADLRSSFLPLLQAHNQEGIRSRIITLNQIPSIRANATHVVKTPEDIRNFIHKEYINHGIRYVLLGGDDDVIPVQQLYFGFISMWGGYWDIWGPSDFYYSCLDGPYNFDGDMKWGEPNDGENGGEVDLIGDVFVGRACVSNSSEARHFVNKTIAYMNRDGSEPYLKEVLMAGEYLWGPPEFPEEIYGDDYMEELIGGSDHNSYNTVGIPNDSYSLYHFMRFYERYNYWSSSQLIQRINQGVHVIDHLGHGNEEYALKLMPQDVLALTNQQHCFIYSQACLAGSFDSEWGFGADCIAEYFTVKTENAAFAVIMNARYGLGDGYGTNGPSQRFNRWFWDGVFNQGLTCISEANQYSKTVNAPLIHMDQYLRFCCYEITLFGDPALQFQLPKPEHDIGISTLNLPNQVKPQDVFHINVTLSNNGLNDEYNVQVNLLVDEQTINTVVIPVLQENTHNFVDLEWITPSAGIYEVTVNVSIPGVVEHDYRNNEVTKQVKVGVYNKDTGELFNSIQEALDDLDTADGHTIIIPRGIYYENIIITKGISLQGECRDTVILDGTRRDTPVISLSNVASASIMGCTIQHGESGIRITSSSNILLRNLLIDENSNNGISLSSSSGNWINSNELLANSLGISIDADCSNNRIYRNNFHNLVNAFDAGFDDSWNSTDPAVGNWWSDFESNPGYPETYLITGGTSQDMNPLQEHYTPDISKTVLNWYTGEQFTGISPSLSDTETRNGHTIFVSSGTYNESITISKTVTLLGENRDTTILFYRTDNQVLTITASRVNISGFTLRNIANGSPGRFPKVLVIQSVFNRIQDNIILGSGSMFSRGIQIESSSNNNTIRENTISHTAYSMYINSVNNKIYHNIFLDNIGNFSVVPQKQNTWDDSYPSGGNYWSKWDGGSYGIHDDFHGENQDIPGGDGILDQGDGDGGLNPFILTGETNQDRYPYLHPDGWL
ncbi:MAG: C25 family cysteine peptidase [Methanobacteriota archaeon]